MDDNKKKNNEPLTKKEKADIAGRDAVEIAARGAGRYYGGPLGGAAVDAALNTRVGQKVVGRASKQINKNPITRNILAKNQSKISQVKPIVNSLLGSDGGSNDSSTSSVDNMSDSYDDFDNNTEEVKGKGVVSGLWKKLPLKVKLIIIAVIAALVLLVVFLIVLITPLMNLGIIDIGMGGPSTNPSYSYSSVSSKTTYWWPIGSNSTTTSGGVTFASGEPPSTSINSEFGPRKHPITGENKMHTGVDMSADNNPGVSNIIAVQDGTVTYPSNSDRVDCPTSSSLDSCGGGYGNYVVIQHTDGKKTLYAHLHENTITVRAGDTVKQGQVIGKMGSSGNSTGTHLHFEVRENGSAVNPMNYINFDNSRPKGSSVKYTAGSSNKESVCLTLRNAGFSDNAVAALLTNINSESSFNPTSLGDNGTSYGLCQWHNGRYDNLRTVYPDSYQTIGSQIEYLIYELENKYVGVYNALNDQSQSANDLTYNFCVNFEVPYDTENVCKARSNNTSSYYEYVVNGCK